MAVPKNPIVLIPVSRRPKTFEECYKEINEIIIWNRYRWRLNSITWMDFDDVAQAIRIHISDKWSLWDQSRPLRPWVSRTVTNQIINIIRNVHTIHARPCVTCKYNQGGNSCEKYGDQDSTCPLFAKWEKSKKAAYEIANASSIQGSDSSSIEQSESHGISNDFLQIEDKNVYMDLEKMATDLHSKMQGKLTRIQWLVYQHLYIEHKTEEETAKLMGYYSCEEKRSPGYKQIKNIKKQIFKIAKDLLHE